MARYVVGLGEHQVLHDAPMLFFRTSPDGDRYTFRADVPYIVVHGNTQKPFDENGKSISEEQLVRRMLAQ